MINVLINFM